jgi:hypothetical protein
MNKKTMICSAFHSVAEYLSKLQNSPEDWHLAMICGNTQIHQLFAFCPADLTPLQIHGISTVSLLFDAHLKGEIDKTVSPDLLLWLQPYPGLHHNIRLFTQKFK